MSKKGIMGLIALMCFVVLISGCISGDTNSGQSSDSSGSGDNWKSVETFSGTGDIETDTFQIKGDKFKIKVKATGDATDVDYLMLSLITYEVGEDQIYVSMDDLDFTQMSETDEFIINEGPGEYYIKVIAANLDSWEIEVFDYV